MREAVGGSLLLYLVIPIIVLIIAFIGFVMRYASAYRAANYVVTQIETCQGNLSSCGHTALGTIKEEIQEKYHYTSNQGIDLQCDGNSRGAVYRVSLPVEFELPVIGNFRLFSVTAETKTMMGATC